jgi:hypothetical protein
MHNTSIALVAALLFTPLTVQAEESCNGWFCDEASKLADQPVAIELHDGSVVNGVIVEIAPDHVTVVVNGAKVTLAWPQIATFKVGGAKDKEKDKDVPKEPEPYEDEEEEVAAEPKAAKPATVTVVTKDEPKTFFEPAPVPLVEPLGRFTLGARAKLVAPIEDGRFSKGAHPLTDFVGGGVAFELAFALRLNRVFFLRGAYEHSEFVAGELNRNATAMPTSDALGIGVRALFGNSPDVKGVFEVGVGYRWLNVPYTASDTPDRTPRRGGGGIATYSGSESLRLAVGSAFAIDAHGRFEVLLEGSFGRFTHVDDDRVEPRHYAIPDTARTHYAFFGISLGVELGP